MSARQILFFRNLLITSCVCFFQCALAITGAAVEDWSQFLGPRGDSQAENAQPPIQWDPGNFVWRTDISGKGWSSPVIAGNQIWLTTAITRPATAEQIAKKRQGVQHADIKTAAGSLELRAICVNVEDGSVIHDISLANIDDPELINPLNSYASPTAAIANGKVICHFGNYGTWCLDQSSGRPLWKKAYVVDHSVGPGSSPVIHNGKVILVCDGIDDQYVACVNLETGQEVWKTPRPQMRATNGEYQKAYSTPLILERAGKSLAVIPGAQWIVAYETDTGKEIWRADHGNGFSVTPMPSLENGLVIFATGYMRPEYVAVDPSGQGDVTATHIKWRAKQAPAMPSFVSYQGRVFSITDKGILNCLDATNGKILKRKRIGGNFSASPLFANGNLYLCSREGVVTVVRCDEDLSVLATNKLDSGLMASPAPLGDDLIIRTEKKLYRISNRKNG